MRYLFALVFLFFFKINYAQYAGAVGTIGTTAMYKDSSAFINWAATCHVTRGLQDIAISNNSYTTVGADSSATGKAGTNGVVSLGDGGVAILTFTTPITNQLGFDFAVFENAFTSTFLELAFVEVSSDGLNYTRFPATSNTPDSTQIGPFDNRGDATLLNNLAGKYITNYGTPFDLQELQNTPGLDINAITHIKIIDVVGCITSPYATYDNSNNAINDPYPTAFGSGGFDLDAVGVINQLPLSLAANIEPSNVSIYPNPTVNNAAVCVSNASVNTLQLIDFNGVVLKYTTLANISLQDVEQGVYLLKITTTKNDVIIKKIIKN